MSGLALIHNWFPDPYLTNRLTHSAPENSTVEYWDTPFPMTNIKTVADGFSSATWIISGLPAGEDVTACARYDASGCIGRFRPVIVVDQSWKLLAQSEERSGGAGIEQVRFAVPQDGVVKLRLCAPNKAGENASYSQVMVTETATFDQINALLTGNMVFGYNLMPDPRG